SILETYPLDFSRPELSALRDLLAGAIHQPSDIEDLVTAVGVSPGEINWTGRSVIVWRSVLVAASKEQKLHELLETVSRAHAPLAVRIAELVAPSPVLPPAPHALSRAMDTSGLAWKGFGQERTIVEGSETLLGVAFLEIGVQRSRSVCRITSSFGSKRVHGTAALIGDDLLLTNHHVLFDWDHGKKPAVQVEAWFNYEFDTAGQSRDVQIVACDPTTIQGDDVHDWAVVRAFASIAPTHPVLRLTGAQTPKRDDYVFIVQHPNGGPKMVGLSHNLVRHVDDDVLQYWTDTESGSSGAPVFDKNWEVVGLHHWWVNAPPGDGTAYRNQGRRISRVLEGLAASGVTIGQ
nr:serine protease [Micromonospora sp. DSM 115978]